MKESKVVLARRTVLKTAGLGVGAGLLSGAATPAQAASDGEIWSAEYWTKKGDVPLYIFRKRLGAPKAGEAPRPVLFLVHGSSVTWRIFDLDTPGHGEYSMMNVFARWGFDVWTMDHENYGKSGRTSGNSDIASGAQDLKAAMPVVAKETGRQKVHFMGDILRRHRADAQICLLVHGIQFQGMAIRNSVIDGVSDVIKRPRPWPSARGRSRRGPPGRRSSPAWSRTPRRRSSSWCRAGSCPSGSWAAVRW